MALGPLEYRAKITARSVDANGVLLLTFQVVDGAGANAGSTVTVPIIPEDGAAVTAADIRRIASRLSTKQAATDAGSSGALLNAYIAQGIAL